MPASTHIDPAILSMSEPTSGTAVEHTAKKRVYYTPELKLQLIWLCINNGEQYIQEALDSGSENTFWQHITLLFQESNGSQMQTASSITIRRKVLAMVDERKSGLQARRLQSGVALQPVTDLDQAIDSWIQICERRIDIREKNKVEASSEVKKEKLAAEVLRDNLSQRLSKKRDYQAVVEAREEVDLTAPGDTIKKR